MLKKTIIPILFILILSGCTSNKYVVDENGRLHCSSWKNDIVPNHSVGWTPYKPPSK